MHYVYYTYAQSECAMMELDQLLYQIAYMYGL